MIQFFMDFCFRTCQVPYR